MPEGLRLALYHCLPGTLGCCLSGPLKEVIDRVNLIADLWKPCACCAETLVSVSNVGDRRTISSLVGNETRFVHAMVNCEKSSLIRL